MSALGLTCREAFTVFSQNETLRLAREVLRLKSNVLRLETKLASFKARFIHNHGCYHTECDFCERTCSDCRCDWTCDCFACCDDRIALSGLGYTDDEIRTFRRRPAGCIQVCDVCGADYNEACSCGWTCECRVCDEFRGLLKKQAWTDEQLKDYNREGHRLDPSIHLQP